MPRVAPYEGALRGTDNLASQVTKLLFRLIRFMP
jgi:hypothetical protein